MNVKRVPVAGVVIECWRQLDVDAVWESNSCACLPRQHEGVRYWNFLACLITGTDRWIRPYRILRILIVINELRSVHEDVKLQFERLSGRRCYDSLTFLTVASFAVGLNGFTATSANIESKSVLILLSQAFRIDVVVPQHRRGYERLWHSAAGKLE